MFMIERASVKVPTKAPNKMLHRGKRVIDRFSSCRWTDRACVSRLVVICSLWTAEGRAESGKGPGCPIDGTPNFLAAVRIVDGGESSIGLSVIGDRIYAKPSA